MFILYVTRKRGRVASKGESTGRRGEKAEPRQHTYCLHVLIINTTDSYLRRLLEIKRARGTSIVYFPTTSYLGKMDSKTTTPLPITTSPLPFIAFNVTLILEYNGSTDIVEWKTWAEMLCDLCGAALEDVLPPHLTGGAFSVRHSCQFPVALHWVMCAMHCMQCSFWIHCMNIVAMLTNIKNAVTLKGKDCDHLQPNYIFNLDAL